MNAKRFRRAARSMSRAGYEAGAAAGSWLVDGNTPAAWAARLLAGLADGDPAVLDLVPAAPFSGEWAGAPTPAEVLAWSTGLVAERLEPDDVAELVCAFENAYGAGAVDEVTWSAAAVLGLTPAPAAGWSRPVSDLDRILRAARAYAAAEFPEPGGRRSAVPAAPVPAEDVPVDADRPPGTSGSWGEA